MIRSHAVALLLLCLLAIAPPASGQRPELGAELAVSGLVFDNFFQAPDHLPKESITAGAVDARVGPRLGNGSLWVYGRAGATSYEGLDTSVLVGGGVMVDASRHALDLQVTRETDRPTLDVGDEVEPAEVVRANGEYGYRVTDDWELKALGEFESHDFEVSDGQSGDLATAGGAVRFRGWGYDFSPEVGARWGRRDANDPGEDYDQSAVYVQVRSVPVSPLYLSFRYRHRTRDYTVADPLADNAGRSDDRDQLVALADYRIAGPVSLFGYWAWETADSSKETRVFTTQYLIVGVRARW
ncbi:MAG: hypothetical protein R3199_02495 [Gemmatimonadota bacterium]|nr:hypothetical protein [Gemmatimonadota bacterium]